MPDALVQLSTHVRRPRQWLWPGRIPLGCLTLVDGDPGVNKSILIYDIAARVTQGRGMYGSDQAAAPGNVVLLQAEDTMDDMWDRLEAAGADLDRVFVYGGTGDPIEFPRDIEWLEATIREQQARFVVIDPAMSFITVNANHYQAVQRALVPLAAMAQGTEAAVALVRHLNKSGGSNPLYRGSGSIGLIGAARSGLLVAIDPADPGRRVLAQTKTNLGTMSDSLSFRPVERGGGVAVEWLGTSVHSARRLLEAGGAQSQSELEDAMYFLYAILANGTLLLLEIARLAREDVNAG